MLIIIGSQIWRSCDFLAACIRHNNCPSFCFQDEEDDEDDDEYDGSDIGDHGGTLGDDAHDADDDDDDDEDSDEDGDEDADEYATYPDAANTAAYWRQRWTQVTKYSAATASHAVAIGNRAMYQRLD